MEQKKHLYIKNIKLVYLILNFPHSYINLILMQIVYRYNDLNHWIWVIKKEIYWLFLVMFRQRNFNCLLITTNNPEIFENDKKNLLKIISNNF